MPESARRKALANAITNTLNKFEENNELERHELEYGFMLCYVMLVEFCEAQNCEDSKNDRDRED